MNFHGISSAVVLVMANEVSRNSVTINSVLNDSMIFSCVTAVFCDSLMGNAIMCRTLARCISRSEYFGRRFASCKSMAPLSTGFAWTSTNTTLLSLVRDKGSLHSRIVISDIMLGLGLIWGSPKDSLSLLTFVVCSGVIISLSVSFGSSNVISTSIVFVRWHYSVVRAACTFHERGNNRWNNWFGATVPLIFGILFCTPRMI